MNKKGECRNTGRTHFKKGMVPWNKGGHHMSNENHPAWKENPGYRAIHAWVQRHLGKASKCQVNLDHVSNRYHWANISHNYLRDLNDWIEMCPKCHYAYDRGKQLTW